MSQEIRRDSLEPINISYAPDFSPIARILSNLAPTRFELDGVTYESVEGFWQGLYRPSFEERAYFSTLSGLRALREGRRRPAITEIIYEEKSIEVGSPQHRELMRRALQAKFHQHEEARRALIDSGDAQLTHDLFDKDGKPLPDSTAIPASVFIGMLMEIREELRRISPTE